MCNNAKISNAQNVLFFLVSFKYKYCNLTHKFLLPKRMFAEISSKNVYKSSPQENDKVK